MRILAIRGSNLASLQGDFEVDLEAGLGAAGLYAITGPTGAGKSTLLDALCLALFDCTPRLDSQGGARIGRPEEEHRLAANDCRALLRRGCGRGHAEVDFQDRDGRRYRARWEVRRARDRAEGRMQAATVTLHELPSGRALGDSRKTDTLAEISRCLGLTFDQFRRSVLLAQGDFAAFLKATGDERAELLEKMTGTEHYSSLSRAAHERAGVEKAALARLEDRLGLVRLRSLEELQGLRDTLAAGTAGLAAAEEALGRARAEIEWHQRLAELARAESQAVEEAGQATLAWEQALPLRQELADLMAVEPLRPALGEADRALRDLGLSGEKLRQAEQDLELRAQEVRSAAAVLTERERAVVDCQEQGQRLEPELKEARGLDVRLGEAARRLEQASAQAAGARDALSASRHKAEALAREEAQIGSRHQDALDWLAEKANLGELVRQWDRWESVIRRFREADRAWTVEESRRPVLAEASSQADGVLAEARQGRTRALEALGQARAALQQATEARSALSPEGLVRMREGLDQRLTRLRDLVRIGQEALRCRQVEARARGEAAARRTEAERAARDAHQEELLANLEARRQEARRALDGLRASLDLEERRAGLRGGEPCPLCGSVDHPYRREGAPAASALQAQEDRVANLDRQAQEARQIQAQARTRTEMHQKAALDFESEAEKAAREASAQEEAWLRNGAAEPDLPVLAPGCLDQRLASLSAQREEVGQRELEANRLTESVHSANQQVDRCQGEVDKAADALAAAEGRARQAREVAEASGRLQAEAVRAREEAVEELRPAFAEVAGWEESLRRHPQAFAERCTVRVAEWNAKVAERDQTGQLLTRLASEAAAARALVEAGTREAGEKEQARRTLAEEAGRLEAERARKLGGRPTGEVEGELRRVLEEARRGLEEARRQASEAETLAARAAGHRGACQEDLTRRQESWQSLRQTLDRALADLGLEEEQARRRLDREREWADRTRAALEELETRRREAGTVLQERARARQQHEASAVPPRGLEEARQAADLALQSQSEAQLQVARAQSDLEFDAERRREHEALAGQAQTQRERWRLWESLRELIGSADGKRFRVFAQGLTLDALLTQANAHLVDLAPRYRLDRVPSTAEPSNRAADLEIQVVDLDMGEAVRSVQSLSGGESFLVSLALALGLSSMAAERTRIDSLFIDEGFGSLDAETLETALSCLEALQAGGRQVGIISHVSGLAERIGARVRVEPQGSGRSRVLVEGPSR